MTAPHRSALIVGAGIGGLAAGLALQRAGWQVRIFERASSPRELGFALLLAPNAMRALRALGLAEVVTAGGALTASGEMRRANGDVLRRFDMSRVTALLQEPMVTVLRPVLHGTLLDAVGADAIALDAEVTGFIVGGGGVSVTLADGRSLKGDLLIGADGVGSVVRRQLHPAEPAPRASGLFAVRGVAHGVVHLLGDVSGFQYFGRGVEAGVGRASDTAIYWYLSLPAERVTSGAREPAAVLQRSLGEFDQTFRSIVGATRPEDMRLDELFDRDPIDAWGHGPVTLLGDAAHPMLPHAGQGAAQALEDAVALGRVLHAPADIEPALRRYEQVRTRRTRDIVLLARRNARLGSLNTSLSCWMRDAFLRLVPESMILRSVIALNRASADMSS